MKKKYLNYYLVLLLLCAANFVSSAPVDPPGISWKRSDRLDAYPALTLHPDGQLIDEAAEDWWYDHKNSYDEGVVASGKFNGFVTCGYTGIRNIEFTELLDGCDHTVLGTPQLCDDELDYSNFTGGSAGGNRGAASFQTIARYDPYGNLIWYLPYNHGWFSRVIQDHDGNYIAAGVTNATRWPDRTTGLEYNPGQSATPFYFNSTIPYCSETKVSVVKIDPNGKIIWNYIYGVKPSSDYDFSFERLYAWD